ncbi:MAG: Thiamine-monophosphate kinase [Promethearchaeota archaeon]|nr:MAG: Thiamine-monophosphate kinase [Candidatus Lokiarchaeota archaeon]
MILVFFMKFNNSKAVKHLGESTIIHLIEEMVLEKTNKPLLHDDAFFLEISPSIAPTSQLELVLSLNTDMLVATTDVPTQMSYPQIGFKSVLMNISDLIVKGVKPKAVIISLGLPADLMSDDLTALVEGIIDCCVKYDVDYIGGDVNETKELVINPTVLGWQEQNKILYRKGMNKGDILATNGKFGLTGVGFDILLNKGSYEQLLGPFNKSIQSVLNPRVGLEALVLSSKHLATATIDSSDGLSKSLRELMISNPGLGFEINFDHNLYEEETKAYSSDVDVALEDLVFSGGEEFIHLFTIRPEDFEEAKKTVQISGGVLYKIGKVIDDPEIYILSDTKKYPLSANGYEHFTPK